MRSLAENDSVIFRGCALATTNRTSTNTIMKKLLILPLVAATGALSSCVAPVGLVYSDINLPSGISSAPGKKVGKSQSRSYFALVATGDSSVEAAKNNGGITSVSSVDTKIENILGVAKYTTTVTGN